MVQLEIQGKSGRSDTRQHMINYKVNDGVISLEACSNKMSTLAESVGSVMPLSQTETKGWCYG